MKRILLLAFLLIPFQCVAQTTRTAATFNLSDVQSTVNASSSGDTVQIPCSGAQSVTWAGQLTVPVNITITALGATPNSGGSSFGAGTNCLTITSTTGVLFELDPTYLSSNNVITLQNLILVPGSGAYTPIHVNGTGNSSGMPEFRVDNVQFGNGSAQWAYGQGSNTGEFLLIVNNAFGVADHNTSVTGSHVAFISVNLTSYFGVGLYGDNSWAQPDSLGGANNVFIENNQLYQGLWPVVENEQTYPNIGGGRAVTRFNHITASGIFFLTGGHGNDTDGRPRSMRTNETYGNTVNCVNDGNGNACYDFWSFRGGSGLAFGNTATLGSGAVWNEIGSFSTYRFMGDGWSNVVTSAIPSPIGSGSCGGAMSGNAWGPFDQNDGVAYFTGTLTSGTGGTSLVVSGSPGWAANQWSAPSDGYPYSVWDTTQGWVSVIQSNGSNTLNVSQAPHGYINGGTSINAVSGNSFEIVRAKSCLDGAARGAGLLLTGIPPVLSSTGSAGPANQVLDPIYEWDEAVPSLQYGDQIGTSYAPFSRANREYFTDNSLGSPHVQTSPTSPFNGSSGIGFGTLANRPSSGTSNPVSGAPGTGYFATDQGSWNTSGNGFGQGILYTWNGSWVAYYTPYTYPHPLAGGTPQAAPPTALPVGGTYSSTQTVTLSDTTPSSTILYCTDTTNTCTPSTTYSTAITVSATGYIRAFATASGFLQSSTVFFGYIIGGTNFTWTPTISPSAGGSVSGLNANSGSYASGTTIGPLTPVANSGYVFASWSAVSGTAACSGSTVPCPSFNIAANSAATANFTATGTCGNPTQNPPNFSGTYNVPPTVLPLSIGFTSPTSGCSMFMTLDGSTPTCSSTAYAGQSITSTTPMRVIACQAAFTSSAVVGGTWTIVNTTPTTGLTVSTAGTGTGTVSGPNCSSNFYGSGTTIGACTATPTGTSTFTHWSGTGSASACAGTGTCGPFNLTSTSTIVATFTAGATQAATPVITPATGTYSGAQSTSISCATPSSTINYTLDGSTPTTGSATYSAAFNVSATTTIKAICNAAGFAQSNVATSVITITTPSCGLPTQNGPPTNPTYSFSNSYTVPPTVLPLLIGFTSPTAGCSMFMTLDGSAPTCSSTAYSAQSISVTTVMRVIACQATYTSSSIVGGTWTIINPPPPPTTVQGAILNNVVIQ